MQLGSGTLKFFVIFIVCEGFSVFYYQDDWVHFSLNAVIKLLTVITFIYLFFIMSHIIGLEKSKIWE